MENSASRVRRKPGRPLGFDRDAAIRKAMHLFWRHGYEATSVSDLTAGMGITPPSLYTAFGDKKQLFLEAVRLYTSGPPSPQSIIEQARTSREAAESLLNSSVVGFTGKSTPRGCLLASSAISCSAAAADVQRTLALIRIDIENRLRKKIVHDQERKLIDASVDSGALAGHVTAVIQGMSTLARDGASRQKLRSVVSTALRSWPT